MPHQGTAGKRLKPGLPDIKSLKLLCFFVTQLEEITAFLIVMQ